MFYLYANYYYNIGFNVSHISSLSGNIDDYDITKLKAPSHEWLSLTKRRQSLDEIRELDWDEAIGIGAVLGHNNIRAIDIDKCSDYNIIKSMLKSLGLRENYEWVINTGNGYHIIFKSENHNYLVRENTVKAFKSKNSISNKFKHLELRYNGHLVLPPSIHYTYKKYRFINDKIPVWEPSYISLSNVENMLLEFCNMHPSQEDLEEIEYIRSQHISIHEEEPEDTYEYLGGYFLIFDCETNGLPVDINVSYTDIDNWPRIVSLSWTIINNKGENKMHPISVIIKPEDFIITDDSTKIHKIPHEQAIREGVNLKTILEHFGRNVIQSNAIVCHNAKFDINVIKAEFLRCGFKPPISQNKEIFCTMDSSIEFCQIQLNGRYKYPTLSELYYKLFGEYIPKEYTHDSLKDMVYTKRCFLKLKELGVIDWNYFR